MPEDFFVIDIPVFAPFYDKDKKYGWNKYKDALWDLLKETTGGYCMYCYDTVFVNEQKRGQIEHGIEKANSLKYLSDCVPNLGLACENCNQSYKRRGEAGRRLPVESIREFESDECQKYDCKKQCEKFEKLRNEYIKKGKILLQPFESRKQKDGKSLRLQYDLLKCKYVPSKSCGEYDEEDIEIINGHIKLFGLNSPERKNFEIGKYCKNVIDNESIMSGVEYNNLIVDLFRKKLQSLEIEDAIKICRVVYENAFLQLAT